MHRLWLTIHFTDGTSRLYRHQQKLAEIIHRKGNPTWRMGNLSMFGDGAMMMLNFAGLPNKEIKSFSTQPAEARFDLTMDLQKPRWNNLDGGSQKCLVNSLINCGEYVR